MLIARKAKDAKDNNEMLNNLKQNYIDCNIENSSLSYIIEEDNNIIGGCNFYFIKDNAVINFLVIDKNKTGEKIGDGLLRAVLNYCLINGIKNAYFLGNNQYFIKKGFREEREFNKDVFEKTDKKSDTVLVCNIEKFLSKKCCP